MCSVAPSRTHLTYNSIPTCGSNFWNYPFHAHSDPGDDVEDVTVEELRSEIWNLLSVEFACEFGTYYRKRLSMLLRQTRNVESLHIAYLMSVLGCKLNALELHHDAEKLHRRALCIGMKGLGSDHPDLTGSMGWLTFSLYQQGHFKEAVLLCYSMIVLVHQSVGSSHPDLASCYFNLAMIVEAMGLGGHASVLREKGLSLWNLFYPMAGYNYCWPVTKGDKSMECGWNTFNDFYSPASLQPAGVWIPAGYSYGGENLIGTVHSF